jgi:hypothetical protein
MVLVKIRRDKKEKSFFLLQIVWEKKKTVC